MVFLEKLEGGGWRVSRVFPCGASMQAGAAALEAINPAAFTVSTTDDTDGNTSAQPSLAEVAAASIRLDREMADDDLPGIPGDYTRCDERGCES